MDRAHHKKPTIKTLSTEKRTRWAVPGRVSRLTSTQDTYRLEPVRKVVTDTNFVVAPRVSEP
eukprot:6177911-Pleurochrysis_carterae.AAC.1